MVLQAVIDHGGYAHAAEILHRSQSSVSYTIAQLQKQLGVELLSIEGRKARLTEIGASLLQRARHLLNEAQALESFARALTDGWEPQLNLVVEALCPTPFILRVLQAFETANCNTRIMLRQVVLSGVEEALDNESVALAIGAGVPPGYLADPLITVEMVAVAHHEHPLHQLRRELTAQDLRHHRQVVISDSGVRKNVDAGWLDAERRWTVSTLDMAKAVVVEGFGFGWLPYHEIAPYLNTGTLRPLPLREGGTSRLPLNLIYPHDREQGPATRQLVKLLLAHSDRGGLIGPDTEHEK